MNLNFTWSSGLLSYRQASHMSKAQCHFLGRKGLLEKGLKNAFGNDLSIMLMYVSCPLEVCSGYH